MQASTTLVSGLALLAISSICPGSGPLFQGSQFDAWMAPWSMAAADLDGDGRVDLAVVSHITDGEVLVLLNKGDGTFSPPARYPVGEEPLPGAWVLPRRAQLRVRFEF